MDRDSHKTPHGDGGNPPPLTLTTPDHSERKHLIAAHEFPFKRFPFPIPPPPRDEFFLISPGKQVRREMIFPAVGGGGRRAGKGDALKMQISSSRASF